MKHQIMISEEIHGAVIDSATVLPTLGDVVSASSPHSLRPSEK